MKVILRNLLLALYEQGPPARFIRNFFITMNAWGMFYRSSHEYNGKPKVRYNTQASAVKAAKEMSRKHKKKFSHYKCIFCNGYHIGKNRIASEVKIDKIKQIPYNKEE